MSQKGTPQVKTAGNSLLRALTDLVILALLLAGAGFGGYFVGIHQQLAPIQKVPPGTTGAILPDNVAPQSDSTSASSGSSGSKSSTSSTNSSGPAESSAEAAGAHMKTVSDSVQSKSHKKKFWITSQGIDYIGYLITVKVNGSPVDSFFGPGKSVDITGLVKPGDNILECDAKEMGEDYQKHGGDASSKLTLQLVSGSHMTDSFKKSDVLLTYQRTAAETDDSNDTLHFSGN